MRKFFAAPFDKPLKSIRVRLCARGFNGQTLDDSGTRSYACQVGTVWWDNLYVTEQQGTIRKITPGGVVTTIGGAASTFGSFHGTGSNARFSPSIISAN